MNLRIPDLIQQKYAGQAGLKEAMSKLDDHADLSTALRSHHLGTASPAASTSASAPENQTRTLASPEWGTNPPINIRRKLALTPLPTSGFESSTESLRFAQFTVLHSF